MEAGAPSTHWAQSTSDAGPRCDACTWGQASCHPAQERVPVGGALGWPPPTVSAPVAFLVLCLLVSFK